MSSRRKSVFLIVLIALPVMAAAVLHAGLISSQNADARNAVAVRRPTLTLADILAHTIAFHGIREYRSPQRLTKIALKMPTTAQSYQYQSIGILANPYTGQTPSAASFTLPAPLLYDGSVGDTSTGYVIPSNGTLTVGGNHGVLVAMIDLGPSPPGITYWNWNTSAPLTSIGNAHLYSSTNGTTWTLQDDEITGNGTKTPFEVTSNVVARYWMVVIHIYTPSTVSLTDFHIYDNGGTIIGPPATAPTVTLVPSQTFDRLKNPIDSLVWTSAGATSVSISASAGLSPGSVTPVAGGSVPITPPTSGATYTATAVGPGGTTMASTQILAVTSIDAFGGSSNGTPFIAIQGS